MNGKQQGGLPMIRNGNQAIAFMKGKETSKFFEGYMDNASMEMWYEEDPTKNYLGKMAFWNQMDKKKSTTIFDSLMTEKSIIEVNGRGSDARFTYSIPAEKNTGCYVDEDGSEQNYPGLDGGIFYITLNKLFQPGTILGYTDTGGYQIMVSEDEPTEPTGTGYKLPVVLTTKNKRTSFPREFLRKGTEFFVISHGVSEHGTRFAQPQMPDTPDSHMFEFRLGSVSGVESYITGQADSKNLEGWATASTREYASMIQSEMDNKGYGDFVARLDLDANGNPIRSTANIGSTMEFLTQKYLHKIMGTKLMFQQAGEVKTQNGVIRLNEGLWQQVRRGRIIEYGRPNGITKMHIQEAAEYIFRNTQKRFEDRVIKFKCGTRAYYNVIELFKEEINSQLAGLAPLLGTDRTIPSNVTGSLTDLTWSPVTFTKVFLPNVGIVDIEWDPSLDRGLRGDRFETGMHGDGMDWTSYSMVIWDAASDEYSNNTKDIPQGTSLVEGGNKNSNVFLVKPEGALMYSGTERGRYDSTRSRDIVSSNKYMGEGYWAYMSGDVWVKDPSRFVMIELKKSARRGFN